MPRRRHTLLCNIIPRVCGKVHGVPPTVASTRSVVLALANYGSFVIDISFYRAATHHTALEQAALNERQTILRSFLVRVGEGSTAVHSVVQ